MNRIARRTTIALLLIIGLIGGMLFFLGEYLLKADDWAVFAGNPHVYTGSNIGCGLIYDSDGNLLLDATKRRVYAEDYATRLATLHWLGDRGGNISAPAVTHYSEEMSGFDLVNGLYSYGGTGGSAAMTFSAYLQKVALDALGERKGTVAVYNYETGQILCAVSTPTYDPDNEPDIKGDTTGKYEGAYLNRFTQVSYVPGSIFKIVTAAAALEEDLDNQYLQFHCNGAYSYGYDSVTCEHTHGLLDMKTALAKSCNCYFAQLVDRIGADALEYYVQKFQITERIRFDGITTAAGAFDLSSAAPVEVAWSGIGQYTDQINPCRYMVFMGAIAGEGEAALPYVVEQVFSGTRVSHSADTQTTGRILGDDTARLLKQMLRNNVVSIYGEWNFQDMNVCAKSGTAQLGGGLLPNATFSGFIDDAQHPLAFIVVVENAGSGSEVCVPIMSKVLEACVDWMDGK